MIDFSNRISEEIIDYNNFSDEAGKKTLMHLMDYFASSMAGYRLNSKFNRANYEIYCSMEGKKESSVLFSCIKLPAPNAAYLNAIYAHGADFDDGNSKSAGHIGTHVIPAVLSVAEKLDCTWKDVICAINVGYDVFNWIGELAQPHLYKKGFHSTGVIGVIACSAACSKLLDLNCKAISNAISLSCVQAGGLILIDESGQACKPINPGNAAKNGIISAMLAQKGILAPNKPFESQKGWFNAFSENIDEHLRSQELKHSTIEKCYLKIYPTCRHTHACIEGALEMCKKFEDINAVKIIEIRTYENAIRSAGQIVHPSNSEEAKFSIKYAVAIALAYGNFTIDDIFNVKRTNELLNLENKIVLISDESLINEEKTKRGCHIRIVLVNGHEYEYKVDYPRGEFDKQLNWRDLEDKMRRCASGVICTEKIEEIAEFVKNIDIYSKFEPVKEMYKKV